MNPKQFFVNSSEDRVKQVASEAGTNFANFRLIALYGGACSWRLAKRLESASDGDMTADEILAFKELETSKAS